jgi:hypothetical protein
MRGEIAKLRLETTLIEIKVRVHANTLVMPGLDPGIHPSSQEVLSKKMDCRERRQVYVVCARQTTMPGNDTWIAAMTSEARQ